MAEAPNREPNPAVFTVVSVVLPTRNRASSLARAIDSVLSQTFPYFELIVVDDHSTDGTDELLAPYLADGRVRWVCPVGHGCAAARNVGVSMARGRFVAFQDSDDEWLAGKLQNAVEVLESANQDVGVVYTDMLAIESDGQVDAFGAPDVEPGVLINERKLDYQVYGISIQSAVIRRECFDRVGTFDEALRRFIDLDLFIRLSDRYRFIRVREPLVVYTRSSHADRISNDRLALVHARLHLLKKYRDRLARTPHHLAMQYLYIASATFSNREWVRTIRYLVEALRSAPGPAFRVGWREIAPHAHSAFRAAVSSLSVWLGLE